VERGEALAIFPQGAVRTSGPWHRGAAKLALAAGAPLLPVGIIDTDRAIAGSRVGFPRVRVVIGRPIHVERQQPTIAAAKQLTERLRATIEALTQHDAAVSNVSSAATTCSRCRRQHWASAGARSAPT